MEDISQKIQKECDRAKQGLCEQERKDFCKCMKKGIYMELYSRKLLDDSQLDFLLKRLG